MKRKDFEWQINKLMINCRFRQLITKACFPVSLLHFPCSCGNMIMLHT